ncbi:hypothetical protein CHS0354_024622 [Potamilus streckersoni]|uniref:Putative hydroxypyruvate isomerase n=1 Tax=Potamilus streckersoni TaxID=2493646 RepID=A0AAE0S3L7_9BIVA|nr:hypothetical protein CHS0354_024622 [Potamilus streckersoni]
MPLKFAANISMLFNEIQGLANRFAAAKEAGFKFVECTFPYSEPKEDLAAARKCAGLEHVLMNGWPGNMEAGDLGIAAIPGRSDEFQEKLEMSIGYAKALECKRMHLMAGRKTGLDFKDMEKTYLENLQYAADRLQKEGIMALIEPLNTRVTAPNYFLTSPHQALEYIKRIDHPNLKLQFDVFHVQLIAGDLTANLKAALPFIGHIQIAQAPDRGEPDLNGEINYKHVFRVIEEMGYDGYIGLEYKPRGESTLEGLRWMEELGVTP